MTCLEGFLGTEEWLGGGARVDDPGWRFGTPRWARFGAGRSGEWVLEGMGASVGMRRDVVGGGGGGGAMRRGAGGFGNLVDGNSGGGIMLVEVTVEVTLEETVVLATSEVDGGCICSSIAGSVAGSVDGSERVKLGTASSHPAADTLGVGWSSSPTTSS